VRASLGARGEPYYMTYEVWSDALALELVVDLLEAGANEAKKSELRALGAALARALAGRQRTNGGWSYFQAVSLDPNAAKPEQSISFVTATVAQALLRAKEAGVDIDAAMLERALDALAAMRGADGVFHLHACGARRSRRPAPRAPPAPPAAPAVRARAPARRQERPPARLHGALDRFFEHSAGLAKEAGKALMHCGPEGQGCHYVLYDYATAARAIAALPAAERKPYRARLVALLDATRRADGSFFDTPILGGASGTARGLCWRWRT
jgi:hypothetical protein